LLSLGRSRAASGWTAEGIIAVAATIVVITIAVKEVGMPAKIDSTNCRRRPKKR
jgi:hypothetical protein